jgi:hypothetical protein
LRHLESNYTRQYEPTDSFYQEAASVERNYVDGYVSGYEQYENENLVILHDFYFFLVILYAKIR